MVTAALAALAMGAVLVWLLPTPGDDEPIRHFLLRLNNIQHHRRDK